MPFYIGCMQKYVLIESIHTLVRRQKVQKGKDYFERVLIAYDENYFEAGEVMLYSLSKNSTQSFKIHFFYHEMGDGSLKMMEQTIEKINSKTGKKNQLVFYDIGTLKWDLPVWGHWPIQAYFRLLAPEYIMEEKVLYLDADIIVKEPIDELFEINMRNVGMVMCEDPDNSENRCRLSIPDGYIYCNSGVMLMNLDYLRTVHFGDLISGWLKDNGIEKLNCPDQDIINGVGYQMMKYVDCNIYNCVPARVTNETKVIHYMFGGKSKPWGSCSSKGNLNFNCLLMLTPPEVIDYVVVHELCHRKEMNHSKAFWSEVEKVLPDYKAQIKWLKDEGGNIMRRNG